MPRLRIRMRCAHLPRLMPVASLRARCRSLASASSTDTLQAGDVIELSCSDLAFGGDGVCKTEEGFVIFVPRALPGERLTARLTSAKRGFARAEKLSTLHPHDHAVTPPCPHFGPCGGCTLQALDYVAQLTAKQRQVTSLAQRIAGVGDASSLVRPIVPCASPYGYRNKMEFSVAPGRGPVALGLHRPGSATAVLPVATCDLQTPVANEILAEVQRQCRECGIEGSSGGRGGRSKSGKKGGSPGLQHVVIRHSTASDTYLVNFVTSGVSAEALAPVAAALRARFGPALAGCVNSISPSGRPAGERRISKEIVLEGQGFLIERLCGLQYQVSPNSFFQINTAQADLLFSLVLDAADLKPTDTVLDLYCGAGALTLPLAQRCAAAHGVELSPSSVADARRNAEVNKITNVSFTCSDAGIELPPALKKVDVVVVDPARPGLSPEVVDSICGTAARRLVYVSCNPATQARDIAALCSADGSGRAFKLMSLQPVDMYPQTPHVETVAVLDRV